MSSIIAGGAGFIGVNLAKELMKDGSDIFILDNFSNSHRKIYNEFQDCSNVYIFECDLSNINDLRFYIKKIIKQTNITPVMWHLAANSDIKAGINDPNIDLRDTFLTTFNLLLVAKEMHIKNFIFASSSAIYGDHNSKVINENTGPLIPISNYGAMKLASEAQCFAAYESYLSYLRIFRFPNVIGTPATHGVIYDFINKLIKNPKTLNVLGNGTQNKSYMHVDDLIKAMIYFSNKKLSNDISPVFNLGPTNDTVSVKWIAEEVVRIVSPNANIIYGLENRGWVGDVPMFLFDTSKANDLGWNPSMKSKESVTRAINEIFYQLKQ